MEVLKPNHIQDSLDEYSQECLYDAKEDGAARLPRELVAGRR